METQPLHTGKRTKIDIYRSTKPVPACKSFFLLTLDVRQRIAYVLKIEAHATLNQARPFATPASKQMPVRALTRLVATRPAEPFVLLSLHFHPTSKTTHPSPA